MSGQFCVTAKEKRKDLPKYKGVWHGLHYSGYPVKKLFKGLSWVKGDESGNNNQDDQLHDDY